ncbi:hypothetical protein STAQ_18620 [Allostella sp. ATCC 35155]|nr:hypothetical protein STAQ_18620 [Stella sp. ATCC 35155]
MQPRPPVCRPGLRRQTGIHVNAALNNGCTPEEIQEALYQTAAYCGLPAAIESFRVAEDVLRERGVLPE